MKNLFIFLLSALCCTASSTAYTQETPANTTEAKPSYSPENLILAQSAFDLGYNKSKPEEAMIQFDELLARPNLTPLEISTTYFHKANILKNQNYYWPSVERTANYNQALKYYELALTKNGLSENTITYVKNEIDTILRKQGLPKKYAKPYIPTPDPKQISAVEAIIPAKVLRGKHSGYCIVEFHLDTDGKTKFVAIADCTDKILEAPSIESVSQWIYEPLIEGAPKTKRDFLRVQVTYNINNKHGEVYPYPKNTRKKERKRKRKYADARYKALYANEEYKASQK